MPRLVLTRAITLIDGPFHFRRGVPIEVDEDCYFRLLHSGKLHDPDLDLQSVDPIRVLPKLAPGTEVIIAREMGLGDVLMVTVAIRALKEKFPHLKFTLATGTRYVDVLGTIPFLERIIPLISLKGRYPHSIDLRGLSERHVLRNSHDRMDIYAKYMGVTISDYTIPVTVDRESAAHRAIAKRIRSKPGPRVALTVRGSTPLRTWPIHHVRRFAELGHARGWTIVALDQEPHDMPAGTVNLTGQLDIVAVKSVLAECDFCIAPDTGLLHLAEAVGTKTIGLFTMVNPRLRITHYKHVKALARTDLPCIFCLHKGCKPMPCANGVTPEQMIEAVERFHELPLVTNPAESLSRVPVGV